MKHTFYYSIVLLIVLSACRQRNETLIDRPDTDLIESRAVNTKATKDYVAYIALLSSSTYTLSFSVEPVSTGYVCKVTTNDNVEIYDDSFAGYPTALPIDFVIGPSPYFRQGTFILGSSVGQKGKFEGNGKSYLGFREKRTDGYHYGWISVDVPVANGHILVHEYGIMNPVDYSIKTAQVY